MRTIFISFILLFGWNYNIQSQVDEKIEPSYIKTIQFKGSTNQSQLPILQLGEPIQLSFDALNGDEADFYYVIDHFDFDWTPSDLSKGEFLEGFDDVRIYEYENSFNTLQIYSNYRLSIPNKETRRIKKSGNYILSIFDDDSNLVFSRKFMIVEHLTSVSVEIKRSRDFKFIGQKQIVQFSINSPNLLITNPKQTVKTLVLQNNNLKTAITDLKPQYTIGSELIYRYDKEAAFWGGNEFQNFDNKTIRGATSSIRFVDLADIYENYLYTDISRKDRPYTYNPDINGNFVVRAQYVENQDIEADYARIYFNLQFFEDIGDKEIHLYGNFNNWSIDESTYMVYDEVNDVYSNYRLFKQGFYNYKYVLVNRDGSIDEGAICGDFWQTENDYTVLVYYRDLGARYDRIVGLGRANSTNISNN